MLRFVSSVGLRIPDPPLSQGPVRVLRDPASSPHPRVNLAHLGLHCLLRDISGLRGSFRIVEKVLLPRPTHLGRDHL